MYTTASAMHRHAFIQTFNSIIRNTKLSLKEKLSLVKLIRFVESLSFLCSHSLIPNCSSIIPNPSFYISTHLTTC